MVTAPRADHVGDSDRVIVVMPGPADDGHIDVGRLLRAVWRGRWYVAAAAVSLGLLCAARAFLATPVYRAEALVSVVEDNGERGLAGITGSMGALASLAGFDIGALQSRRSEYIAMLNSRAIVGRFVREHDLLPILYSDRWDEHTKSWRTTPWSGPPQEIDAVDDFIEDVVTITDQRRTGLVEITVDWKDPVQAAEWANELVALVNAEVRTARTNEAKRGIEFLERELARTSAIEIRQAIHRLHEMNLNRIMMANVQEQYALRFVDPAVPPDPDRPEKPRKLFETALGFTLGALLAAGVIAWRRRREWWLETMPADPTRTAAR